MPRLTLAAAALAAAILLALTAGDLRGADRARARRAPPALAPAGPVAADERWPGIEPGQLPAEFEPVREVLIGWDPELADFFTELVAHTAEQAPVTVVVASEELEQDLRDRLGARGVNLSRVRPLIAPVKSVWVRDYGPLVVRLPSGGRRVNDLQYFAGEEDDALSAVLQPRLWPTWSVVQVPLLMEGGNLLSDGSGRCVTTDATLEPEDAADESTLRDTLRHFFGCERTVILPALVDDATGHVDMFATLTGPGAALVGRYAPEVDPVNAPRLDQAARQLEEAGFAVRRVPMPSNRDRVFRTYTNAMAVNGVVLVPVYPEDRDGEAEALGAFAEAYPDRAIVPVDASRIIPLDGSIHCAMMTIAE